MKLRLSALAVIVLGFITAGSVSADLKPSDLTGHWRFTDEQRSYEYSFLEDGTFTGNVTNQGSIVWVFAGKWSLAGDVISYEFTSSSTDRVAAGTKDQDKLVEVTKDYILLQALDGSRRKYSRVAE